MADRYFTLDEFLLKLQICQKYTGIIYLNFKRENLTLPFRFKSMILLYAAITIVTNDCICNITKIIIEISSNRLSEAKQIGAVYSIELLCLVRGISLLFKYPSILNLTNSLDKIFPRTLQLQKRMNINKFANYLTLRHRILRIYAIVGLSAFIGIPLLKYFMYYDKDSGQPLLDEYHQHASWLPYQLKENPKAYPYIYVWESVITIVGLNCLLTWDHIYTVSVAQFIMHFEFINEEIKQLNALESVDDKLSRKFYKRVIEIIKYHQHLTELGDQLRKTFNLTLFVTDLVSAASICFHIYLMVNSDDIISIVLFTFPCFVQVAFTFDNCYQGTRVAEASALMTTVLFEHNWYDGSLEYRRLIKMLMQFSNNSFSLSGHNLFNIDMVHFRGIMLIAYRMFAFLQSRGKKTI